MSGNSYNGFIASERRAAGNAIRAALADGRMLFAASCSICNRGLTSPHQMHLEDYAIPLSPYPICRRCHTILHMRFVRPEPWRRLVAENRADQVQWFELLTLDPASRWQSFDEIYPSGLPPAASGRSAST